MSKSEDNARFAERMSKSEDNARFAERANRYARRLIRKIMALAAVLAALMWLFIGGLLWSEHESALNNGLVNGRNLAAAFAVELTHTVDRIDGAMDAIIRRAPIEADGTPRLDDLGQWEQDFALLASPAKYFGLMDADGKLIFSNNRNRTGPNGSSSVDLSDREHFRIHRDHRNIGLYISPPLPARLSDSKMIYFSKRIETPDGRFCGVLVFLVPPIELARMRDRIDLGKRGVLMVVGTDDIVRVRVSADYPDGNIGLGASLRGAPWPESVPPGGFGSYRRIGLLDPVDRQLNYRRLEHYPLIVNVGLDIGDLLGEARAHAWILGVIGIGMTSLVFGLSALLTREIRRRIFRDVQLAAERNRLEAARRRVEQAQAKLADANADLTAAAARAEAANQAKSNFLANMSHELRTPLHAIIGFSELIQDRVPRTKGDSAIAEFATDILASGRHLLALINAILDISKVESGTESLLEGSVRVLEEARASLIAIAGRARGRGVTISLDIPDTLPVLRADATKIRQILINLMSNAVKFTESGGQVSVAANIEPDGRMKIAVRDTGIGMTNDDIDIALQPFGQVDSSLSRSHEGTGLGLPLAQRLAELHGGTLAVESEKGRGTTVFVWMPSERVG